MSESIQSIEFEPVGSKDKLLARDQKIDSAATLGEHFAIGVISKTKEELTSVVENLGEDAGETFLNCILEAQDSLEMRWPAPQSGTSL